MHDIRKVVLAILWSVLHGCPACPTDHHQVFLGQTAVDMGRVHIRFLTLTLFAVILCLQAITLVMFFAPQHH